MNEVLNIIVSIGGLIVGVLLMMGLLNYAIKNNIPMGGGTGGGRMGSGYSSKEVAEDAARRAREWTKKGIIGAAWAIVIGAPLVVLAEYIR